MNYSNLKPTGTNVGFIRLTKMQGAAFMQIVDFTRYELSPGCSRFREENWISSSGSLSESSRGRNTDDFRSLLSADEYFAWWLKAKLDDHYTIMQVEGKIGPLPSGYQST